MNFPSSLLLAKKWSCSGLMDHKPPIDVWSNRIEVHFCGTLLNSTLLFTAFKEIALTHDIKLPEQWCIRSLGESLSEYTLLLEPGRILKVYLETESDDNFNLGFSEDGKELATLKFVAY